MNRITIIGNGFDLAHGMKTSYYDFICDYIRKVCKKAQVEKIYENKLMCVEKQQNNCQLDIKDETNIEWLFYIHKPLLTNHTTFIAPEFKKSGYLNWYPKPITIHFKNSFIEKIFTQCHDCKWVDIENEFFEELKVILKDPDFRQKQEKVNALNMAMKCLTSELETYISSLKDSMFIEGYKAILEENILKQDIALPLITENLIPNNHLILNFNYTDTIKHYNAGKNFKANFIHGHIYDVHNPLIFGFGDEIGSDYKRIEDEKVKGALNYINSFGYFRTSNYHNLIKFISSDIYQIHILGHSCGLSDRTMLNMLFENDNCKSIKIFYYGSIDRNNFGELTQEISRHFINKTKLRERIVPFDKSIRMPQWNA
ncbi:MAG: AbiH family protein [Ginsengibacter sp.]